LTEVQVSVEAGQGLERRIRVQVPANRIEQEVAARLQSTGRSAKLKGFRPGKVPLHVVKQRFGPQIRQEVLQDVVQSSYSEAIAREKLRPASTPAIQTDSLEEGKDLTYTAVVEVYPDFAVTGLDSLRVNKPEAPVGDAEIESTIEKLREQRGTWQAVDRPAVKGDRITVSFEGMLNGAPLPAGKAEGLPMIVGAGRMIPEFEANLVGLRAGEHKDFPVRFPKDYYEAALAGQEARFELDVKELAELRLPPVDEQFVKAFGIASGELAEMRRLIAENLRRDFESRARADMKRQVLDQLLAANPVAIPNVLAEREAANLQADSMSSLGIKDRAKAPPLEQFREVAARRVRLGIIIAAIIRDNNLQADGERVRVRLDQLVQSYDRPEEVRAYYLQNPELMAQVENAVLEDQVIDWLLQRAKIEPKTVTFAEIMNA
jgi:trigger factor